MAGNVTVRLDAVLPGEVKSRCATRAKEQRKCLVALGEVFVNDVFVTARSSESLAEEGGEVGMIVDFFS